MRTRIAAALFFLLALSSGCSRAGADPQDGGVHASETAQAEKKQTSAAKSWRSALYPKNWTPGFTIDGAEVPAEQRRMLHDFSYAGYHRGEKPIPANPPGKVYDITRFGAKPDDQLDDTAAIQNAIDAAGKAGGGIVTVPRGEYRIQPPSASADSALWIRHSGVVLRGTVEGGKLVSRLLNTSAQMRSKQVVRVYPPAGGTWSDDAGQTSVKLREDLLLPTSVLPVEQTAHFQVGDWIVVGASTTEAFIREHGMLTERYGWKPDDPRGPRFCRQITAVNAVARTISIDIPTRYPLKIRDQARLYKIPPPIQEVGIENLRMAMLENTKAGWDDHDYEKPGTGAHEVHGSSLIVMEHAANCWVRRVETYQPGNTTTNSSNPAGNYHVLSYGIRTPFSRGITVADCVISNPQYRGEGGNGYAYVLEGSDSLFVNSIANNSRHAFSHKGMGVTGNVIWRCTSNTARLATDFHMWLSAANLIDNMTLDQDSISAAVRPWGGKPSHGITTSRSVLWNTHGVAYQRDRPFIVNSRQWGHGYVIGTRGPARVVQVTPTMVHDVETGVTDVNGTIQPDWVEGAPRTDGVDDGRSGDTLEPASLYADQLERRLRTLRGRK
ncbi:MAG TPA: glycosyl hydrolase family 28-related protein [Thermoanaerobaculia bacterium]|nr:glycosyl hydrolase family 28-related protein [Thermoanaerobaculia bacterium]